MIVLTSNRPQLLSNKPEVQYIAVYTGILVWYPGHRHQSRALEEYSN